MVAWLCGLRLKAEHHTMDVCRGGSYSPHGSREQGVRLELGAAVTWNWGLAVVYFLQLCSAY